jgi:hypothetical protein
MNENPNNAQHEQPSLEDDASVFRAIRKRWIDEHGQLLSIAFLRRIGADPNGLSVNTTREASLASLKNLAGTAELKVGRVRELGLDVIPTADHPTDANINARVPYPEGLDKDKAEHLALQLVERSVFQRQ